MSRSLSKRVRIAVALAVLVGAAVTGRLWLPSLRGWVQSMTGRFQQASPGGEHDAHGEGHAPDEHAGHSHGPHGEENSINVSVQARRNLGLTPEYLKPVSLSTFRRAISVPAIVAQKPGRTLIQVATPMTAIVTRVHAVSGEAVQPGQLLFELRLTHEDLVASQTEFLTTLGAVDVEKKELERLKGIVEGAIAGKLLLERQYAIEKLENQLRAEREALKLHGLSDAQVASIETGRTLLRTIQVFVPEPDEPGGASEFKLTEGGGDVAFEPPPSDRTPLVLERLLVHQGQSLPAGQTLCVLADYRSLYIEGQAFERDAAAILRSREQGWPLQAVLESAGGSTVVDGLRMAYVANEIDLESRTLRFYVDLPNELLPPPAGETSTRFVTWKYRPGQRLELRVPVEEWPNEIVLPVDAVAREGAESYVFLQNGGRFDRRPVHVKHRDKTSVVIANDGSIFPGDVVAWRSAHLLLLAIKNQSGGGADPHAGHQH